MTNENAGSGSLDDTDLLEGDSTLLDRKVTLMGRLGDEFHCAHILEWKKDDNDVVTASNRGFFALAITNFNAHEQRTFAVVSSKDGDATLQDIELLRNLINDFGLCFGIRADDRHDFGNWKHRVFDKLLEHPAITSVEVIQPDFDSPQWLTDYRSGVTIEDAYQKAVAAFEKLPDETKE